MRLYQLAIGEASQSSIAFLMIIFSSGIKKAVDKVGAKLATLKQ